MHSAPPPDPHDANRVADSRVTPLSGPALATLERLWARATANADTAEQLAVAAVRVGSGLGTGLTRWIGREGYQGLLIRALDEVRAGHPWMAGLRAEEGRLTGLTAATDGQPAGDVRAGTLALIVALAQVLGRITGEAMAIRLMEQSWAANEKGTQDA